MNAVAALAGLLLMATQAARQADSPPAHGVIYGTVLGPDGQPARHITLEAEPLDKMLVTILPLTITDDDGHFRFEDIPWWGVYTVIAQDEVAGYSNPSTVPRGGVALQEVTLSPEHREAEFNFRLPPKAGFLKINLTNRQTQRTLDEVEVTVMSAADPDQLIFTEGSSSARIILVPPDENLLLHVSSHGYEKWADSVGKGKPLRIHSGERLTLDISLDPSEP